MTTDLEARPTEPNRAVAATFIAIAALLVLGMCVFFLAMSNTDKHAQRRHESRMHCNALGGQLVEGWVGDELVVFCIAPERR